MTVARVLVVDDEPLIVTETVRALAAMGFEARGSTAPSTVGAQAKRELFDVVLLDIHMEEYSGLRVLLDLGVAAPSTKVIVMSARNDVEPVLECIRRGAVDFVSKPFDIENLVQRLRVNVLRPQFPMEPLALRENLIECLWANVKLERGTAQGRRLEQLLYHVFASIEFFRDIRTNLRGDLDEIDVEAINDGDSAFWRESGSLIAAECKNWSLGSRSAGIQEHDHFAASMQRSVRYKVGFFVSMSGFSPEFEIARMRDLENGCVIIPVDADSMSILVKTPDRAKLFEDWIRRYSR
jgi:DNA-binding response OmpR family regulator